MSVFQECGFKLRRSCGSGARMLKVCARANYLVKFEKTLFWIEDDRLVNWVCVHLFGPLSSPCVLWHRSVRTRQKRGGHLTRVLIVMRLLWLCSSLLIVWTRASVTWRLSVQRERERERESVSVSVSVMEAGRAHSIILNSLSYTILYEAAEDFSLSSSHCCSHVFTCGSVNRCRILLTNLHWPE